jgi:hypothetical protein
MPVFWKVTRRLLQVDATGCSQEICGYYREGYLYTGFEFFPSYITKVLETVPRYYDRWKTPQLPAHPEQE